MSNSEIPMFEPDVTQLSTGVEVHFAPMKEIPERADICTGCIVNAMALGLEFAMNSETIMCSSFALDKTNDSTGDVSPDEIIEATKNDDYTGTALMHIPSGMSEGTIRRRLERINCGLTSSQVVNGIKDLVPSFFTSQGKK